MTNHILVVDDDAGIRKMIGMVLESEGFSVATAADGHEALDRIAENRPALVLLDLQMPVMSGWETLSHLRNAGADLPVVFMTAGYRAKAEAERCGADGYVGKPFDLDTLLEVVERLVSPLSQR